MNLNEKSMAYALIAEGVQIYNNSSRGYLMLSKLVCRDCKIDWPLNKVECFLCGDLNPFVSTCSECGANSSINRPNNKCSQGCKGETLTRSCLNNTCLSNTKKEFKEIINKKGGVFKVKESGFSIALQYCITCGSNYHIYKSYRVYVRKHQEASVCYDDLNVDENCKNSSAWVILKHSSKNNELYYSLHRLSSFADSTTIKIEEKYKDVKMIISELFNS